MTKRLFLVVAIAGCLESEPMTSKAVGASTIVFPPLSPVLFGCKTQAGALCNAECPIILPRDVTANDGTVKSLTCLLDYDSTMGATEIQQGDKRLCHYGVFDEPEVPAVPCYYTCKDYPGLPPVYFSCRTDTALTTTLDVDTVHALTF